MGLLPENKTRVLQLSLVTFILFNAVVEPSKLIEVFKKARCIFPKDIDSITRALLLQQCFSRNQAQGNETVCYEELGCFPMESPWVSLLRPFPTPHTPDEIDVKLYLYTRNKNEMFSVPLWPKIDLNMSDFDPNRDMTVFIVHGFANNGNATWMSEMKDAYLENVDANVFLVDWGNGACLFNYLQVASNTRIVGAEVARFVKYLLNMGVKADSLHMIGHSLGSHISSYTAKNVAGIAKLGRITALDPAQPGFEIESTDVRLVKDDAEFVDVIHTDAKPFIPFVGFGLLLPAGHVDFYLNGGTNQPGCLTNINIGKIKSIYDLADVPVEVVSQWVACSHGRAYDVFIAALQHKKDCLWARKIPFITNIIKVTAMGALNLLDPFLESWDSCTMESCTTVGLLTPNLRGRGIFALSTTSASPFCVTDEERDRKIKNILSLGLISVGNKIKDTFTSLITSVLQK